MTCAKLSLLFLYYRVFQINAAFGMSIKVVGVINLMWCITAVVALSLKCVPVHKIWNPLIPGYCYNFNLFTALIEIPNSLVDFVIMIIPISALKGIQMSLRVKIYLCLVFFLGGL